MAGGLKVDDPAIDLAVVAALISSFEDAHSIALLLCSGVWIVGRIACSEPHRTTHHGSR